MGRVVHKKLTQDEVKALEEAGFQVTQPVLPDIEKTTWFSAQQRIPTLATVLFVW